MSNARKRVLSLAELIRQSINDRKAAARLQGGKIRGLQRMVEKARKANRIFNAEIQLLEAGTPERGMNKKIAQRTKLPYEYVMKVRRAADKK